MIRGARIRVSTHITNGLIALTCVIGVAGCASAGKKAGVETPGASDAAKPGMVPPGGSGEFGPSEAFGPPDPPTAESPMAYGPEPIEFKPVVLVLGPGLARGFAYVGAIRALSEARIPIGAILGTEMGALVGALYAMDAKINRFEWAMLKFKEGAFESSSGLMPERFQRSSRAKRLEDGLDGVFEKRDLSQSRLPVRVAVQGANAAVSVVDRGPAAGVVRAAVADPGLFGTAQWNGAAAQSAAKTRPLLIAEARAMKLGPVVVIDALEEGEEKRLVSASELQDADLIIRPNLAGIGPTDFQKRTDAAFRGKSAVNKQLAEIRHLVGMPAEAAPPKGSQ